MKVAGADEREAGNRADEDQHASDGKDLVGARHEGLVEGGEEAGLARREGLGCVGSPGGERLGQPWRWVPELSSETRARWCWKTAPIAATPVARPAVRHVLLIPEAIPARCSATTPSATLAIAGLARPIPSPVSSRPGISAVQEELTVSPRLTASPAAVVARPALSATPGESLSVVRRVAGGTRKHRMVNGKRHRPPVSGE